MKLITAATRIYENIHVVISSKYDTSTSMFAVSPKFQATDNTISSAVIAKYTGRMALSSCIIDFEDNVVILGKKIDMLKFGNVVYRGVIPLIKKNLNNVECIVDNVEPQE